MKHMILSAFKMKGDVVSDQFMMLWFQKDSLNTVVLGLLGEGGGRGSGVPK